MPIMHYPVRLTIIAIVLISLFACRKETFTTDGSALITRGIDTLHFDTVFTNTGSVTKSFKLFNNNKEGIRIRSITLAGGAASPFRMNVNGVPGPQVSDLAIRGGDSAYVFVSVLINPNAANQPFIMQDSILVAYNGNTTKVHLQAYGQNAHFLHRAVIRTNTVWTSDKPYVITGGLLVQQGAQLTIDKGCRIYLHANAPLLVDGTLKVLGEAAEADNVIFTGNRIDEPYRSYPGGWPGIFFLPNSRDNVIQFARLKNAYQALVLQEPVHAATPVLRLAQTVIDNAYEAGIVASASSLTAQNVVISNSGKGVVIGKGGNYQFTHCTIAGYSNSYLTRRQPLLQISNAAEHNGAVVTKNLQALFRNCIIWGESGGLVKDEIVLQQQTGASFNVIFEGILWNQAVSGATVSGNSITENPKFRNTADKNYDFRLSETSPALNKGVPTVVTLDADGNRRPVGLPDLGAYEHQ